MFKIVIAEDEFLRECRFMIIHKKMSVKKKMKISRNDRIYFPVYRWKSTNNMSFTQTISNVLRGVILKSFPNPLTPSEEKYYIRKYTEGDLEAKHILIERNLRLVAHVIKKYQNSEEDPEDLISIGTIGLIKAVVTFNPDKGNRLAAYASRCIEKATPPLWLHL